MLSPKRTARACRHPASSFLQCPRFGDQADFHARRNTPPCRHPHQLSFNPVAFACATQTACGFWSFLGCRRRRTPRPARGHRQTPEKANCLMRPCSPPKPAAWQCDHLRGPVTDDRRPRHERSATRCNPQEAVRTAGVIGHVPSGPQGGSTGKRQFRRFRLTCLRAITRSPFPQPPKSVRRKCSSASSGPCFATDADVVRSGLPEEFGCFRSVMGYEEIRI